MEESTQNPKKVTISESEEDSLKTTEDEESVKSIETNHDLLNNSEPFRPAIHIPENLYHNIKLKLTSLSNRDKILQIKLGRYQKKHENLNMFIIFVSTVLGIYETFRVKIDDIIETQFLDVGTNVVPIVLSGIITCTASIIKLKKYQEKSDNIHLIREKVSVARSNLKTVQEHLLFCKNPDELRQIKKIYFKTTFDSYCQAQSYLDKYVKEIDYHKFGDQINYSDKFCTENQEDDEMEEQPRRTLDMTKSYDFRDSRASNRKLIVQRDEESIPV